MRADGLLPTECLLDVLTEPVTALNGSTNAYICLHLVACKVWGVAH